MANFNILANTQYSRIQHNRTDISGTTPTIFINTGSTSGYTESDALVLNQLSATDILNTELFFNTNDKRVFARLDNTIVEFVTSGGTLSDRFTTGATLNGNILSFNRNDTLSAYTVNLSGISSISYWTASTGTNAIVQRNSNSLASGTLAVAEGFQTTASGDYSHAQGYQNIASGNGSHAEGFQNTAVGSGSHAEGFKNTSNSTYTHTGGQYNIASGTNSFVHSSGSTVIGNDSSILGGSGNIINNGITGSTILGGSRITGTTSDTVYGVNFNARNGITGVTISATTYLNLPASSSPFTAGTGTNSAVLGGSNSLASGTLSYAEGSATTASGLYSHAEGYNTIATNWTAHAEGESCQATGYSSHAEGLGNLATAQATHVEGSNTRASAIYAHAEGSATLASGGASHAEGYNTTASAFGSHSQGRDTTASGGYAHAEGYITTASGDFSHTEGMGTTASGSYSHVEGYYNTSTSTSNYSHVGGQFSISSGDTAFIHSSGSTVIGNFSSILGGSNNRIIAGVTGSTILGGSRITGTTSDTVYGVNFNASGNIFSGGTNLLNIFALSGSSGNISFDRYTTGATFNNNILSLNDNTGGTINTLINNLSGLTVNGNVVITGTTNISGNTSIAGNIISGGTNLSTIISTSLNGYVTTGGTQTLLNKTLTSPILETPKIFDDTTGYNIILDVVDNSVDLTADRTLLIDVNDGNRQLVLRGNLVITGAFTTLGSFATTFTTNATTNLTLPSGGTLSTLAGTETLTNKRVTQRVGTTTSSATPTINTDTVDYYELTAQTVNITSFTTNLSGTPTNGQKLWIAITGTAARTIAWGASFESSTITLPTTTVTTARLDVGFIWNSATSKWRCIGTC